MVPSVRVRWGVNAGLGRHDRKPTAWPSKVARTWQDVVRVTLRDYATAAARPAQAQSKCLPCRRFGWSVGVAIAGAAVAVLLVVVPPWRASDTYATSVGEQRTVILEDGTRMSLNTATRVRVSLASAQRTVRVEEGEALFEVAKDAYRPFVVQVADREVVALGTVFSVRLTPAQVIGAGALDVTLVEGQVSVRTARGESDKAAETKALLLKPDDRLRLSEQGGEVPKGAWCDTAQMDRPNVDHLMAWRRTEAVFNDVPLSDAVAEMNRYSRQPIVLVGDESAKWLRISGCFGLVTTSRLRAGWGRCTGWSCAMAGITWTLRRNSGAVANLRSGLLRGRDAVHASSRLPDRAARR